jgi:ATP-dependent protease HslVU (ClpYQ) peptidase subunit
MTVVLAYSDKNSNTAFMAGDSCASDPINQSLVKNPKVFHPVGRRDILIGCAGSFRMPNLMQHVEGVFPPEEELATKDINMSYLVTEFTPVIRALTEDFDDDDMWEMLIAVGNRIYRMQMDLSILEPADDCDAIGIGGSVALGAFKVLNELAPYRSVEERMKHALNVACSSCQGCAPPFLIEKNEEIPKEILDKIPKKREKKGYEIVRAKDSDEDEAQVISLEELLGSGDSSDKKKKKDEYAKEKKDRFKLRRKRKNSII